MLDKKQPYSYNEKYELIKEFFTSFLPRLAPNYFDCFLQLAKSVTIKSYKENEIVIFEGDEADSMLFWVGGSWRVFVKNNNKEVSLEEGKGYTIFGEQVIVSDHLKRKASIRATSPSKVIFIYSRDLKHMANVYPKLYVSLLSLIILVNSVRLSRMSSKYSEVCSLLAKVGVDYDLLY